MEKDGVISYCNNIHVRVKERLFRLTGGDVAVHGIYYDRNFGGLLGGDADVVGDGLAGRFTGWLLGFLGRLGARSPGCFLLNEVLLQPFGWETHCGYEISGEERERRGREKGGS
jgi:hypothetical protein